MSCRHHCKCHTPKYSSNLVKKKRVKSSYLFRLLKGCLRSATHMKDSTGRGANDITGQWGITWHFHRVKNKRGIIEVNGSRIHYGQTVDSSVKEKTTGFFKWILIILLMITKT